MNAVGIRQTDGRFLALKGYRELLRHVDEARNRLRGTDALAAVAHAMRSYAIARPAMSAAAFGRAAADCPEWRQAHDDLHAFMIDVFEDCDPMGFETSLFGVSLPIGGEAHDTGSAGREVSERQAIHGLFGSVAQFHRVTGELRLPKCAERL